jgi:hypothetical protein
MSKATKGFLMLLIIVWFILSIWGLISIESELKELNSKVSKQSVYVHKVGTATVKIYSNDSTYIFEVGNDKSK